MRLPTLLTSYIRGSLRDPTLFCGANHENHLSNGPYFSDFAAGWLGFSLFAGGTLSALAGGRLGTSLGSYFEPAETWISFLRYLKLGNQVQ